MTWQPGLLTVLFSDDDADKLNQDLAYIYKKTNVPKQHELLASRARELYNRNPARYAVFIYSNSADWLESVERRARRKLVLEVVADLQTQIEEFVPVGGKDDPNLDDHDQYCTFLRYAAAKLNAEMVCLRARPWSVPD
jgi:hypothetical protein